MKTCEYCKREIKGQAIIRKVTEDLEVIVCSTTCGAVACIDKVFQQQLREKLLNMSL